MSGDNIINIFINRYDGKKATIQLTKDSTVNDLYEKVHKKTGIQISEFSILYATFELTLPEKGPDKLGKFHIGNNCTVTMVMQLPGGSDVPTSTLTALPPHIEVVYKEEDMITFDYNENIPKAKMPCGHFITQDSMTAYCRSVLTDGDFIFVCPSFHGSSGHSGDGCDYEYPYFMVRHVARLTLKEQKEFDQKLTENYCNKIPHIRKCLRCNSYCKRKNNSDQRVICLICSRGQSTVYEFCWDCQAEWKTKDHSHCTMVYALKYLKACKLKKIGEVNNCPSGRACPKCFTLIEHTMGCKHMDCRNCKCSFCFVCLKQKENGKYPCGNSNDVCVVATVQNTFS